MFDALQDTPKDFQTKLIDALNSLSQTMEVAPEDAFNQVLCASKDDNQDVKKKMYNWWRGFFEVLGKVSDGKVPKDRESEYNQKIDDLMAEIMKSGDAESTEDEVVMEAEEDLGYQQANKSDEDEMLKDFDFAAQHIGEVANKVKDIVNFVNPYCEKTFNEVDNIMKNTANERGDSEWFSINDLVGKEFRESDDWDDDETYVEPKFKVGDKVCWTDPETGETTCGWTVIAAPEEGDESGDEIYTIEHPRGSEAEVYVDELEPDMMKGSDQLTPEMKKKVEEKVLYTWRVSQGGDRNARSERDLYQLAKFLNQNGIIVSYGGVQDDDSIRVDGEKVGEIVRSYSSRKVNGEYKELKPKIKWYDDGMVNEATVAVDANDVWAVLDLLDDEVAKKNLTDLINSHLRKEDEIMDAIDSYVDVNWHGKIKKEELNKLFTDWMYVIVDDLGLDVDKYRENGEFVDEDKPTSVELESDGGGSKFKVGDEITWRHHNGSLSNEIVRKLVDGGYEVDGGHAGENECYPGHVPEDLLNKANMEWDGKKWRQGIGMVEGTDWKDHEEDISADDLADSIYDWGIKNSNEDFDIQEADAVDGSTIELTIGGKDAKQIEDKVNNALIYNAKNWEVLSVNEEEDGIFIVKLEKTEGNNDEVTLEDSTDEQKPEEVKGGEKKFKKDGETKTLVTGSDKQKVNEMTIEQEIDNPWNLLELLWGQGQENFRDLLESELIDNNTIMMMLEDMELKNLTSINDAFAYDFPSMLDAFGLDGEAWSQDLEIKRKDDDSED